MLREIAKYLRDNGIRAYIVSELTHLYPRPPEISDNEYFLKLSLCCVERCDIYVFIFFRGVTLNVTEDLEALDQGPIVEFKHAWDYCNRTENNRPCLVVFDSYTRMRSCSSLFKGLCETFYKRKYVDQRIIEVPISNDLLLKQLKKEILGFCLAEYAEYAYRKGLNLATFMQALMASRVDEKGFEGENA